MVEALQADWLARAGTPRRDASARRLIELLPGEPIVSVRRAVELTGATRPAANNAIALLADRGILSLLGERKWGRQYEARGVVDLLDRFERELASPDPGAEPARPVPAA